MNRQLGVTLTEMMVVIALIAVLTGVAVMQLPRFNRAPDAEQIMGRVSASLEAAHTEAVAQETPLTITASDNTLTFSTGGENEVETFNQTVLTGTLSIQASGQSSGALRVTPPGQNCKALSLTPTGHVLQGGC